MTQSNGLPNKPGTVTAKMEEGYDEAARQWTSWSTMEEADNYKGLLFQRDLTLWHRVVVAWRLLRYGKIGMSFWWWEEPGREKRSWRPDVGSPRIHIGTKR